MTTIDIEMLCTHGEIWNIHLFLLLQTYFVLWLKTSNNRLKNYLFYKRNKVIFDQV